MDDRSCDKGASTAYIQIGEGLPVMNTGVFKYASTVGFSDIQSYESNMRAATEAFEKECVQALSLAPCDNEMLFSRYETVRPYVIKTLLFIGLLPTDRLFVLLARMIELLALRPDADVSALISNEAEATSLEYGSVVRNIDKAVNVYDDFIRDRITYLTRSAPFSARDAIYDLALYVRTKFYGGGFYA